MCSSARTWLSTGASAAEPRTCELQHWKVKDADLQRTNKLPFTTFSFTLMITFFHIMPGNFTLTILNFTTCLIEHDWSTTSIAEQQTCSASEDRTNSLACFWRVPRLYATFVFSFRAVSVKVSAWAVLPCFLSTMAFSTQAAGWRGVSSRALFR